MTNLFEILKNAPENIVLYDIVFGSCTVSTKIEINGNENVEAIGCFHTDKFTQVLTLNKYGKAWVNDYTNEEGCCLLFPSKNNRSWNNWQKYLIKPGMFVRHKDYDFTLLKEQENVFVDHCGKTYELNDDELSFASENDIKYFRDCAIINGFEIRDGKLINVRETTEPQQEEKKKEEYEFKHFQKVLVRDNKRSVWRCNIFSHIDPKNKEYKFTCMAGTWKHCLPYNETTKHLTGTTLPYEADVDIPLSEDTKYNIEIRKLPDNIDNSLIIKVVNILKKTYPEHLRTGYLIIAKGELFGGEPQFTKKELPYVLPFDAISLDKATTLVSQLKDIGVEAKFI